MRLTRLQTKKYKKYYTVYKITNKTNGLSYIGAHKVKFGKENDGYICSSKSLLYLIAQNPYDFKRKIVARFSTAREADRFETKMIKKYNTFKHGYNRSKTGGAYTANGRFYSIKRKKKI